MDTVWAVLSKRFLAGKRGGPWSEKECTLRGWSWALPLTVCKLCPQDKWMKDTPRKTWPWRHCLYSFSLIRRRKPKSGKNSSSVVEIKKERKAELRLLDLDFTLDLDSSFQNLWNQRMSQCYLQKAGKTFRVTWYEPPSVGRQLY